MQRDAAATPEKLQDSEEICCDTCSATGGSRTRVQLCSGDEKGCKRSKTGQTESQTTFPGRPLSTLVKKWGFYPHLFRVPQVGPVPKNPHQLARKKGISRKAAENVKSVVFFRTRSTTTRDRNLAISARRLHWIFAIISQVDLFPFLQVLLCSLVRQ